MTRPVLVAGLVAALALLAPAVALAAAPFDAFAEAGIDRIEGARVPLDRRFVDESGRTASLADFTAGRPTILVPVLHDCPNICGVTLAGLAQAIGLQDYQPGKDFTLLAFGIDPGEGPAAAKASLDDLEAAFPALADAGVHGLTGARADVRAVTDAIGYRYAFDPRIGQYAHIAAVAVLTADGRLARWIYGLTPDPTDLSLALTEAGEGRIGAWTDQLLLLCYHYDPETGRYASVIWTALRIGGALTVAGGVLLIGVSVVRERRARASNPEGDDG